MSSDLDISTEKILGHRNSSKDLDSKLVKIAKDNDIGGEKNAAIVFSMTLRSSSLPHENESSMDCEPAQSRDQSGGGYHDRESNKKLSDAAETIFDYLVDDAILGLVFEAHRAAKTGLFFLYDSTDADDEQLRMIDNEQYPSVDVFGQPLVSTAKTSKALAQLECVCPQCQQPRLACRFAPHLEKCMGMGRNSFRLASRRLAAAAAAANMSNSTPSRTQNTTISNNEKESDDDGDGEGDQFVNDDDEDDDDWTGSGGGSNAFGKKRGTRKRASGVGSTNRSRKRGGVRVTPKKTAVDRGRSAGDILLNEGASKSDGTKRMRKTNSFSKFPLSNSASGQQQAYEFEMDTTGADDFLSMDSYDPPSPSF